MKISYIKNKDISYIAKQTETTLRHFKLLTWMMMHEDTQKELKQQSPTKTQDGLIDYRYRKRERRRRRVEQMDRMNFNSGQQ